MSVNKSQATNLGAKRDIFEILLKHYCLAVRADEIHLKASHLKAQKSDLSLKWGCGRHENINIVIPSYDGRQSFV